MTEDKDGTDIVSLAVESCFFPLYEVEQGTTTITYNPENKDKRIEVSLMAEDDG